MKRIYLDYAATTPIDKRVAKAMRDFELEYFGNPSSTHREGQEARAKIDFARETIAKFINAKPQEIIFTSGATEANNLGVQGVINHHLQTQKTKPHVVTTFLEHQSVYNLIREFESRGVIEATFVKPDKNGVIEASQVIEAIKDNTILVSVIFVSNEIGTILPVREIGNQLSLIRANPPSLKLRRTSRRIVYHVDAVQAAKFYNCNVEKLNCDLLTLSAHKIYGPKGVGALYIKSGVKIDNLMSGGSQEYGKRPGTQNTAGIVGFAKAIELLGSLEERQMSAEKNAKLRDKFMAELSKNPSTELNGPLGEARSADNVNFSVYNIDQDTLITALDLAGIAASTGSACVSGSSKPSHVIEALGKVSNDKPAAIVRFTLGVYTSESEIDDTIKVVNKLIVQLRHEK